jgi:putative ABC transport system ATP-binding protein
MALISAHNIHRSFGTGDLITHVLKGITLDVHEGDFVAIMGKSGAGKSTLMYQLSVLDRPTEGTLTIDGITVSELTEHEQTMFRLNTLGYVFQDYALVPDLSAGENIVVPLLMKDQSWDEAKRHALEALSAVGLPDKYHNLPAQLSGGEQQRVAIARTIAGSPKIIFADEPTANLDSISGNAIIDLLGDLNCKGQTIVMVTHEEEYTKYCNRLVYMEDGVVVREEKNQDRCTPQ